ncbi:uracil-DNA glycosylase [bacterium]|nr:uracil-DNA glycosylase [bacterium]
MISDDSGLLAAFVAQRMEMGETEWYFKPDMAQVKNAGSAKPRPAHVTPSAAAAARTGQEHPAVPEKDAGECARPDVSEEAIRAQSGLDELYGAVCGCTRCGLGSLRKKFVFGDGNPDADIMFIGEAPGADEDAQGLPFVGRAGQLLTRMIEAIKFTRREVYIGNILKCRPPGNRDPKADEIEMCEPILIRQIEIIKPAIICALGRIAGQTLLRTNSTLGALRGKVHDYHGVKLMVTYHPAALLRNPNWKPGAWEDLKFLRREYDGLEIV